jgi:hypothetical protein
MSPTTQRVLHRAGRKVAQKLAQMPGHVLIEKDTAQAAKHWAGTAALTHGWEKDKGGQRSYRNQDTAR